MTDINLKDLYQMFYEDPDFTGGLGGNPDDSKEKAAWEEAQSRYKQHKNNEKALTVGINQNKADEAKNDRKGFIRRKLLKKQQNPFAIATAKAKEMGYSDFSEGSKGRKKRSEIAEAIKEEKMIKSLSKTKTVEKLMKKQHEDLEEHYDKKPVRRGEVWSEAGHSTSRKKEAERHKKGFGPDKSFKKEINMNTESIVNGVLQDLISKGIIKSSGLKKQQGLEGMSIPAIAGLIGAGAMLSKIFGLENDDENGTIDRQVTNFMGNNQEFFNDVAQMCDFLCQVKDGEESSDDSRGERLIEAASAFHKQCGGGGGGSAPQQGDIGGAPAG